jgi:uncharacterized protein (TIGR03083 family)
MGAMDVAALIDQVEVNGFALATAADAADLEAGIPGCPDWSVRDLLQHVGMVHRWAAAIVGTPRSDPKVPPPDFPSDGELVEWFRAGHRAVVETLRAAPADLDCWYFLDAPSALAFWARRQALETAIHRVDAQGAIDAVTPIDAALARDGMAELLLGFGARKKSFAPGTVRLAPTDGGSWHVTLSANGLIPVQDDPGTPTDATVSGSSCDVYRWMWNRPSDVQVEGDEAIAAEWQKIAVRWS